MLIKIVQGLPNLYLKMRKIKESNNYHSIMYNRIKIHKIFLANRAI
jgi:hypothetical protein